ncbi:MAG: AprI/Inh family metalloprotease inhibitor [Janthinobacterium lividum]
MSRPVAAMLLAFGVSGVALADSQVLPRASEVAGRWQAKSQAGANCSFELQEKDRAVLDPQHCLTSILGFVANSWLVQPDGIVIAGAGLAMPMLLSRRDAGRYSARSKAGVTLWIERGDY